VNYWAALLFIAQDCNLEYWIYSCHVG